MDGVDEVASLLEGDTGLGMQSVAARYVLHHLCGDKLQTPALPILGGLALCLG